MENKSFDFMKELEENRNYLYNCSSKYGISKEEREDLVSETILKAIENKDKFSLEVSTGNFKGWLVRCMYNMFINSYYKKVNHPIDNYDNEGIIIIMKDVFSQDSDSELLMSEIEISMKAVLSNLEYRLIKAFVNGYSYEQMSEIFELNLGTIKSKIHLARKKLIKTFNYKKNGTNKER